MARRKPQRQQQKAVPSITADQRAANIQLMLGRAQDQSTKQRFQAPALMPGVVPTGETAAIAMDSCAATYEYASASLPMDFKPFPGYPYLANLSTRTEYRAFASVMSSELFREWITFSGANTGTPEAVQDEERIGQLEDAIRRHNLQGVFRLAAEHDCLFGRAQVFPKIKNADAQLPLVLSPKTVKMGSLEGFANVEAIWTTPSAYNAIDPTAPDFYKPREWWMLGERIHASRILTIISRQLPDILKPAYNFGGMSLSQLAEPYVNNWLRTRQAISDLINNFSITGLKTNMAQVLQGDCDGADVFARADLFTLTRSNRGLMLMDFENEELVQHNVPMTGLHELQAQSQEHMCSATRIPAMILTGISPTGMNASSEGEMRSFYDWISSQQEAHWRFPLDTCIKLIMLDLWGEIDETITWDFDPLWQPSDKELAEIRTANANADGVYIDRGVLSQEESRKRLANDKSSGYAGIDVSDVPEQPEPEGGDLFGNSEQLQDGEPFGNSEELPAVDKSVSPEQHRAMEAAAHGHSTLGIPKSVGKEFIAKDEFKESDHPRDNGGKFTAGGGGSSSKKSIYSRLADSEDAGGKKQVLAEASRILEESPEKKSQIAEELENLGYSINEITTGESKKEEETQESTEEDEPDEYKSNEDYPAGTMHRFTNSGPIPSGSKADYMMFTNDVEDVRGTYGKNHYTINPSDLPDGSVIDSNDQRFEQAIRSAAASAGIEVEESYIEGLSPDNIVDTAKTWDDPEFANFIVSEVMIPNGWRYVSTPNGAIAINTEDVKRVN